MAHLESLHEQLPGGAGGGSPCKATAAQGSMWAGVRWFYRQEPAAGGGAPVAACLALCCAYAVLMLAALGSRPAQYWS